MNTRRTLATVATVLALGAAACQKGSAPNAQPTPAPAPVYLPAVAQQKQGICNVTLPSLPAAEDPAKVAADTAKLYADIAAWLEKDNQPTPKDLSEAQLTDHLAQYGINLPALRQRGLAQPYNCVAVPAFQDGGDVKVRSLATEGVEFTFALITARAADGTTTTGATGPLEQLVVTTVRGNYQATPDQVVTPVVEGVYRVREPQLVSAAVDGNVIACGPVQNGPANRLFEQLVEKGFTALAKGLQPGQASPCVDFGLLAQTLVLGPTGGGLPSFALPSSPGGHTPGLEYPPGSPAGDLGDVDESEDSSDTGNLNTAAGYQLSMNDRN